MTLHQRTMNEKNDTIGLTDLVDEITRDLDDFRKKHAGDYSVKNITLWWEMEKERLLVRHAPSTVVRRLTRAKKLWKMLAWFTAGWIVLLVLQAVLWHLVG